MTFSISSRDWPLVTVELERSFSDADLLRYLHAIKEILARREPYVMVTDATLSGGISAGSRRVLSDFITEHRAAFDGYQLGDALLLRSSIQRGMLTALTWLAPMPGHVRGFAERSEAMVWLEDRLVLRTGRTLGVSLPPRVR
jgi:hypothetical protein